MGKFKDLVNQKYGKLTVLERADGAIRKNGKSRTAWRCLCECGNETIVNSDALIKGTQVSRGCYKNQRLSEMRTKHGKTNTRLYSVWSGIKNRCYNPNTYEYRFYGARGITMCSDWKQNFMSFYNWAIKNGYDENADRGMYELDRIDCNGDYSPDNCRFLTRKEQMNNMRSNHIIECNGESHSIAEWSRITGVNQYKIRNRTVKLGWSPKRALFTV